MEKVEHPDHKECEELHQATTVRTPDGKYMVRMPLLSDQPALSDSQEIALQRFKQGARTQEGKISIVCSEIHRIHG